MPEKNMLAWEKCLMLNFVLPLIKFVMKEIIPVQTITLVKKMEKGQVNLAAIKIKKWKTH